MTRKYTPPTPFYTTADFSYQNHPGSFAASKIFQEQFASLILGPHLVYFKADITRDKFNRRIKGGNCWDVDAFITPLSDNKYYNPVCKIPLLNNATEEFAMQMMFFLNEEGCRLTEYNAIYGGKDLEKINIPTGLYAYPKNANPSVYYMDDKIQKKFLADFSNKEEIFPCIMTTQQVLYREDDEAPEMELSEEDVKEQMLLGKLKDIDFFEHHDVDLITKNLSEVTAQQIRENATQITKPLQFVAQHTVLATETFPEEEGDPVLSYRYAWQIICLEQEWEHYIADVDTVSEAVQVLENFEKHSLQKRLEDDYIHEYLKDRYNYHYSRWQGYAEEVDDAIKSDQLKPL